MPTAIDSLCGVTVDVSGVGDEALHAARARDGRRVTGHLMDLSQQQPLLVSELLVF